MKKKTIMFLISILVYSINVHAKEDFYYYETLDVVESTPQYKLIITKEQNDCTEVPSESKKESSVLGTILGGVAGGVLGNQIGKGRGKTIATIGGVVAGGMIGNSLSSNDYKKSNSNVKDCNVLYSERQEQKLIGYKNIAMFNGRQIVRYSKEKLKNIRIKVQISQ